jgi:hypothetical protein
MHPRTIMPISRSLFFEKIYHTFGNKIIEAVFEEEPTGIRHRRLRLKTEMNSQTFDRWISHLISLDILRKDVQR